MLTLRVTLLCREFPLPRLTVSLSRARLTIQLTLLLSE
jgi:hypothetical protein